MNDMDPNLVVEARKITGTEAAFDVAEMFFSRTDDRGVIEAGNTVFQRIAGYDWSDLLGAPHKLIRHPETPKGLFYMMWERIKAGKSTGFYVRNITKHGQHYWVFALVTPLEEGYLSTRFKPISDKLPTIEALYQDLYRAEQDDGLSPQKSAEVLRQRIRELGYASYDSFQAATIAKEWEARSQRLGQPLENVLSRFMGMSRAIIDIQQQTEELTESFKAIRTVPMNMRIIASRLENAGGPISAISVNYGQMLDEMATWVRTFVEGEDSVFGRIRDAILRGQFLSFASATEAEMVGLLERETGLDSHGINTDSETRMLKERMGFFAKETAEALRKVETEAARLGRSVLDMKRYVTGLSSTRMMCKIESASISNSGNALVGIVDQLDACQDEIEDRLAKIVELNTVIQNNTAMLRASE